MLNRSKPSLTLNPVAEEVKEMKSVEEEDSDEEEGGSGLKLREVGDIVTPKD